LKTPTLQKSCENHDFSVHGIPEISIFALVHGANLLLQVGLHLVTTDYFNRSFGFDFQRTRCVFPVSST
jgi:hypothetical protein